MRTNKKEEKKPRIAMEKLQPFPFQQTRGEENMKKLVSALLALTMTMTMIAPAFAEQGSEKRGTV